VQASLCFVKPATGDFIVRDTGNCSPRFMRCTIGQVMTFVIFYLIHFRPFKLAFIYLDTQFLTDTMLWRPLVNI